MSSSDMQWRYERMIPDKMRSDYRSVGDVRVVFRHTIMRWHAIDERDGGEGLYDLRMTHQIIGLYDPAMQVARAHLYTDSQHEGRYELATPPFAAMDEFDAAGWLVAQAHSLMRQIGGYPTRAQALDRMTAIIAAEQVLPTPDAEAAE